MSNASGKPSQNKRPLIAVCLVIFLLAAGLFLYLQPRQYEGTLHQFGELNHKLYYSENIDPETVQAISASCQQNELFRLNHQLTLLHKSEGTLQLRFPLSEGVWKDPLVFTNMVRLQKSLSALNSNLPIELFYFDEQTKKMMSFKDPASQ